jgi:hypothetical protein
MMWSALVLLTIVAVTAPDAKARVKVTHRDLVPRCLNGSAVAAGARSWELPPGQASMVFSMRPAHRTGTADPDPGTSAITFTVDSGHRYEVEVRADPMAFSTRAWRAHEWTPVVRDRTMDRIVSSEPTWLPSATGCDAVSRAQLPGA